MDFIFHKASQYGSKRIITLWPILNILFPKTSAECLPHVCNCKFTPISNIPKLSK